MRTRLVPTLLAASVAVGATATVATADKGPKGAKPGKGSSKPTSYVLPGDRVFPEGITREPGTRSFFVSSTTDGTIFKGDLKNSQTVIFESGPESRDPKTDPARTTAVGLRADKEGNLVIAGGDSGKVTVLDTTTGRTTAVLDTGLRTREKVFLNDVDIAGGYAYVTDSVNPVLRRFKLNANGTTGPLEEFVSFTGTVFQYDPAAFNANGIQIDQGGKYAIIVGAGVLYRVDLTTRKVTKVETGGATFPNGDGLLLQGGTLYVSRNAVERITAVKLSKRGTVGRLGGEVTGPQLQYPTTIAIDGNRILAVGSQFDKRTDDPATTNPELPFNVAVIEKPKTKGAAKARGGRG